MPDAVPYELTFQYISPPVSLIEIVLQKAHK